MTGSWQAVEYFGWLRSLAEADAPPEIILDRVAEELGKVEWRLATQAANEGSNMAIMDRVRGRASVTVAQIASQENVVARAERDLDELTERYDRELAAAVQRRDDAVAKLAERRRTRVRECVAAWRARGEELAERIKVTPADVTETRTVKIKQLFMPPEYSERTKPVREWLRSELADAQKMSGKYEGLADRLEDERLASCVESLVWPDVADNGDQEDAA